LTLVSLLLALLTGCAEAAYAQAPLPTTTVSDTVYNASGAPATGTVLVSWSAFTTASGASVPAGNTSSTIGANGALSIALAPNAGAMPIGRQVLQELSALKAQMENLMGIGQPGRLHQLEQRVQAHERSVQQLKGLAGAFGGLLAILQTLIAHWGGHH
jgi:hypothetical protein